MNKHKRRQLNKRPNAKTALLGFICVFNIVILSSGFFCGRAQAAGPIRLPRVEIQQIQIEVLPNIPEPVLSVNFGGSLESPDIEYFVLSKDQVVGGLRFTHEQDGLFRPFGVGVNPKFRNNNVSTFLYNQIPMQNIKKVETTFAFDNGRAFIDNYKTTKDYNQALLATPTGRHYAKYGMTVTKATIDYDGEVVIDINNPKFVGPPDYYALAKQYEELRATSTRSEMLDKLMDRSERTAIVDKFMEIMSSPQGPKRRSGGRLSCVSPFMTQVLAERVMRDIPETRALVEVADEYYNSVVNLERIPLNRCGNYTAKNAVNDFSSSMPRTTELLTNILNIVPGYFEYLAIRSNDILDGGLSDYYGEAIY